MESIYMDNAATSFPKPVVVYEAVDHFNRCLGASPGRGSHRQTLQAGSILEDARDVLAVLFNIRNSAHIAFSLNITEAINTGLKGLLKPGDHVITTSMEHNAVARPLTALSPMGIEWSIVPCSADGILDPDRIEKAIKKNTRLICLLHASNLTGTVMPIAEVGRIAREKGLVFMVDSAQTAGVLDLDVERQGIDILAFTGHKSLFGPQGTGGLYIRPDLQINTIKEGGTGSFSESMEQPDFMPDKFESGTMNTPGIAGLLAGVKFILETGRDKIYQHEQRLTGMLIEGLQEIKRVQVYGPPPGCERTAVVAFNIDGMDCGLLSMQLDYDYGIITRSGLHCAPLAHKTVGTLQTGSCRLSPGYFSTEADIQKVLQAIHTITRQS